MSERSLTHLDPLGRARMVDVTPKEPTHRRALARGRVHMSIDTTSLVARGAVAKGDVLSVARVAGIQAAKRTADLIPLCHPLLVGAVLVNFRIEDTYIEVEVSVETVDRTGVEMEALTACSVSWISVYGLKNLPASVRSSACASSRFSRGATSCVTMSNTSLSVDRDGARLGALGAR